MREILFRAKRKDNKQWVQGSLLFYPGVNRTFVSLGEFKSGSFIEVDKNTVGQYTGLTDKNGTRIFEGDIVKAQDDVFGSPFYNGITGKIVYEETCFFIEPQNPYNSVYLFNECAVYEVIGNIHDNPESLTGGDCNG